jgi:O-antigen ligase
MEEAFRCLLKYREFLYVPLLVTVFDDAALRARGVRWFMAGALTLLALSYFELVSGIDLSFPSTFDYVTLKDRIIHNLLMSFLVYLLAQRAMLHREWRWLSLITIAVVLANMFFMINGRTGYLALGALTMLFMIQHFGGRGLVYAALLLVGTGCVMYPSSRVVRTRVSDTLTQIRNQFGAEKKRSPDPRLEFYETTLAVIGRHPVLGTGTGSFRDEYRAMAIERQAPPTDDPHCEYLMLAVQTGLVGTGLFLVLLAVAWRATGQIAPAESRTAQGALAAIAVGSLFNSLVLGFTGGLFLGYFSGLCFGSLGRPPHEDRETARDATHRIDTHSPEGEPEQATGQKSDPATRSRDKRVA